MKREADKWSSKIVSWRSRTGIVSKSTSDSVQIRLIELKMFYSINIEIVKKYFW